MEMHKAAMSVGYDAEAAAFISRKRWVKEDEKRFKTKAIRKNQKQKIKKGEW